MSGLNASRAALIVVDMQNAFCHREGSFAKMGADISMMSDAIPGCRRLIDSAHRAKVPVIYLQAEWRADYTDGGIIFNEILGAMREKKALVSDTWDAQIVDELKPKFPQDYIIYKNRFSGFANTQLDNLLRSLRVEKLVVCGVTTNICVETTVRDGAQMNYRCFVVRDAVGEVDRAMHDAGLRVMEYAFAKIMDVDAVLKVWAGDAVGDAGAKHDSPEFLRPSEELRQAS
jgi:ureidoacrylate peracid hydrolase